MSKIVAMTGNALMTVMLACLRRRQKENENNRIADISEVEENE